MLDSLPFFDEAIDYNVEWKSTIGTDPVIGDGLLRGQYQLIGSLCFVYISMAFGTTTNGGTEGWKFGIPFVPAILPAIDTQLMTCHAFTNDGFGGFAEWIGGVAVEPGFLNSKFCLPKLPKDPTVSNVATVRNADGTAAVGTGVPLIPGTYPFTLNTGLEIQGWYRAGTV